MGPNETFSARGRRGSAREKKADSEVVGGVRGVASRRVVRGGPESGFRRKEPLEPQPGAAAGDCRQLPGLLRVDAGGERRTEASDRGDSPGDPFGRRVRN